MKTIVFFLEEPSAKEMLSGVLPRILPEDILVRYIVFQGKQDLEKNLKRKLRGWKTPETVFVIMRDQDSGDCMAIKNKLINICKEADREERVLVRVVCRELESFYLGDLAAVEKGLDIRGLSGQQRKRKFNNPDALYSPAEELYKLTSNLYDKVAGSRAIAPHMRLDGNLSRSFNVLLSGISLLRRICG